MRSSAALSALIRLCLRDSRMGDFYSHVRNQTGQPSLMLSPIDNVTWRKKCYLFLVALTWAYPPLGLRRPGYKQLKDLTSAKATLLELVRAWR